MKIIKTAFTGGDVLTIFDESIVNLHNYFPKEKIVILTDETIYGLHKHKIDDYLTIKIDGGEKNKTQATVDTVINTLLDMDIDKSYMLVGIGGGVITDMAGYIANIYKRGIKLGLVPTTILGMTDAAIGGKNGVNVGIYKNMVGTTYRSQFILYDFSFLDTLPKTQWINGFAEIIKHACIKDATMFDELVSKNIEYFIENKNAIATLIQKNVAIKSDIVVNDEYETGDRFLLNFGHTFGHAIENEYQLPHGYAVSIGIIMASKISEEVNNFDSISTKKIINLLQQYQLPVSLEIDNKRVLNLLKKDKKRSGIEINFVLLNKIGEGVIKKIPFSMLEDLADQIL
ncbi:MAG: 3-dehydroquinate synthase [Ferruginibacter sp.]|nr:3-dehydroquinate synthase [Ferruginibacter sp.]